MKSGQAPRIEILKLDESCISNSKLEISDWTDYRADWPVQFEISSFEFEMQDSSNFKILPGGSPDLDF